MVEGSIPSGRTMNFEDIEKNYPRHPVEDDSSGGEKFRKYEEEQLQTIKDLVAQAKDIENKKNSLN